MAEEKITFEKVLNHHLQQNMGQKLTAHLIVGLAALIANDCRQGNLLAAETPQTIKEPSEGSVTQ